MERISLKQSAKRKRASSQGYVVRVPSNYVRAFGLSDNPFDPSRPQLLGVERRWVDNLVTRPLRIDLEPRLMPLFVPTAGPFEDYLKDFRSQLELAGYSAGPDPQLGGRSFAFLITGPQGSGKSTLASVMAHWIEGCGAAGALKTIRTSERAAAGYEFAKAVKEQVTSKVQRDGSCCLIVEDVSLPSRDALLDTYLELVEENSIMLLMFMLSGDLAVIEDATAISARVSVQRYEMTPLAPEHAASYVKSRVEFFRASQSRPLFEEMDLFPFRLEDIKGAVEQPSSNGHARPRGEVTLRVFNKVLAEALSKTARQLPEDYDIQGIPKERLAERLIDLRIAFRELMGRWLK